MIKNLLISLAVAAFSGVSSFIGSPKRSISLFPVTIDFRVAAINGGAVCYVEGDEGEVEIQIEEEQTVDLGEHGSVSVSFQGEGGSLGDAYFTIYISDIGDTSNLIYTFTDIGTVTDSGFSPDDNGTLGVTVGGEDAFDLWENQRGYSFSIELSTKEIIRPDTAYFNCYVEGGEPPIFYEGGDWKGYLIANEGYGFTTKKADIIRDTFGYSSVDLTFSEPIEGTINLFRKVGFVFKNLEIQFKAYFYAGDVKFLNSYYEEGRNAGYNAGYEEGREDGYKAGKHDGLIAGNSYGVWDWLKQAARTTGEFFNIPLLPGFSVGALVTAIAGLAIIWLFVKGFLFK